MDDNNIICDIIVYYLYGDINPSAFNIQHISYLYFLCAVHGSDHKSHSTLGSSSKNKRANIMTANNTKHSCSMQLAKKNYKIFNSLL